MSTLLVVRSEVEEAEAEAEAETEESKNKSIPNGEQIVESHFSDGIDPKASNNESINCIINKNSSDGRSQESDLEVATAWSNFTHKWRRAIISFFIMVVWPLGVFCFPRLMHATSSEFKPTVGTPSYEADQVYKDAYNTVGEEHLPVLVLLEHRQRFSNISINDTLVDGYSELYQSTRDFALNISTHLEDLSRSYHDNLNNQSYTHITSYYTLEKAGLHTLAKHTFASKDGLLTFIRIEFATTSDQAKRQFLDDIIITCTELFHPPQNVNISFTGMHFFQQDMLDEVRADLKRMDFISLPLALLVVALVLRRGAAGTTNLPHILSIIAIPLLTIISATALAGTVMYPIAKYVVQVTQFTPSLMMSLIIAMSIDYSLFLLSRFIEDFSNLQDKKLTISQMVKHSGHTIITSGVTLCFSFLGLFLLPIPALQSVGFGAVVAIASALAVNLSLVPALLHSRLGSYMVHSNVISHENDASDCLLLSSPDVDQSEAFSRNSGGFPNCEMEGTDLSQNECAYSLLGFEEVKMKQSGWYRLGKGLLNPGKGALTLALIVAIMAPVAYFFPQCSSSISFDLMVPACSPSKQAFDRLGEEFGFGTLSPYKIIFDGRLMEKRVDSLESFEMIQDVINQLSGEDFPETPNLASFIGIPMINGQNISHLLYEASIVCGRTCYFENMRTVATIAHIFNAPHALATYVAVQLNVDPFSDEGVQWLIRAREKVNTMSVEGKIGTRFVVSIAGSASIEYDAVHSVYDHFPMMILTSFFLVMVLMGSFFRSFVVPFRSIFSIALTEAFVFGLAVLVFQHGILQSTRVPGLQNSRDISWLPPIFSFSVIMGLSLDYDVFLVSRILEFRLKGFDHKSSILAGLIKTGGIITAAGIIMALAFIALLGSKTAVLNQTAFLLTTAVIVDTFIVRIFVVPILISFTGALSWWPRRDIPADSACVVTCGSFAE